MTKKYNILLPNLPRKCIRLRAFDVISPPPPQGVFNIKRGNKHEFSPAGLEVCSLQVQRLQPISWALFII